MSTGWYGNRVIELIKARSLFVKVWPTPTTLTERRAVLRALQRHGEIEVFKRLTVPETFICATARAATADALVARSPLTFKLIAESLQSIQAASQPVVSPISIAAPVLIHEEKPSEWKDWDEAPNKDDEPSDLVKTFTLRIEPSQSHYEHKTIIRRNPLHGAWPNTLRDDDDFAAVALKSITPVDMAASGFLDWHTANQLAEDAKLLRMPNETSDKVWHIQERILRRRSRLRARLGDESVVAWTSLDDMAQQISQLRDNNKFIPEDEYNEKHSGAPSEDRNSSAPKS